jgi:hypothetical protein
MVCVRPIDGRPASVRLSGTWARQVEEFVSLRSAYRSGSTHSQAAIVLVPFTGLFRRTWDRSTYGTCIVVCHPERASYARFVRFPSVWIPFLEFGSVLDDSGWLVFTFVRLRRLGEKCVPLDRRSAVDSICFLHTIPCLERAGLEHAADTSFSVT